MSVDLRLQTRPRLINMLRADSWGERLMDISRRGRTIEIHQYNLMPFCGPTAIHLIDGLERPFTRYHRFGLDNLPCHSVHLLFNVFTCESGRNTVLLLARLRVPHSSVSDSVVVNYISLQLCNSLKSPGSTRQANRLFAFLHYNPIYTMQPERHLQYESS